MGGLPTGYKQFFSVKSGDESYAETRPAPKDGDLESPGPSVRGSMWILHSDVEHLDRRRRSSFVVVC